MPGQVNISILYLEVLLQLDLVLAKQVLVLLLELVYEELFLDLLLLLNEEQLLLQLSLPHIGVRAHGRHSHICSQIKWRCRLQGQRYFRLNVYWKERDEES